MHVYIFIYTCIYIFSYSRMVGQRISDSYVQYILALVVPSLRLLYVPMFSIIIINNQESQ